VEKCDCGQLSLDPEGVRDEVFGLGMKKVPASSAGDP
jgi:hypothetical protein